MAGLKIGFGLSKDSSGGGSISGSGANNYVAKWTPNGTTLGIGLIQDNGMSVSVNSAINTSVMLYVNNSTKASTIQARNTFNDGTAIVGQASGGGTTISGGSFQAISNSSTNNVGMKATVAGTITGSNVAGSFYTGNTPYTITYLGNEYVGIHSQIATSSGKSVGGLFITDSSSADNIGVYIKATNTSSSNAYGVYINNVNTGSGKSYGIYESNGSINYLKGTLGIGGLATDTTTNGCSLCVTTTNKNNASVFYNTNGNPGTKKAIYSEASGVGSGTNIGGSFVASGSTVQNIGLLSTSSSAVNGDNIGIKIDVGNNGSGNAYIGILQDGSEASGSFLKCIDANGTATWGVLNDITLPILTDYSNSPTANAFEYDCDLGASQHLDMQGSSADVTLTFANEVNGVTYSLLVVQGVNEFDLVLPSGWWLNDTAPFDFSTELANDERALLTASYIFNAWYFAVKKVTYVA
jgi:hypothetical protein